MMLAYTVREEDNGEVEICVEVKGPDTIECPVVYPLEFIVTVTDITASMYKQLLGHITMYPLSRL